MSEYLPFWPKAAAGAYVVAGNSAYVYSRALPTNGFTEVVLQLQIDADFGVDSDTYVEVIPQISNDGTNWEDQATGTFLLNAGGSYPKEIVEKFTEIGAFMRMKIRLYNGEALGAMYLAPTVMVAGVGRS